MSEPELVGRLEKLERDNRRLKGFGLAALVIATAFATIYATQPIPETIKAHEFEVVDGTGNRRVSMGVSPVTAYVMILDEKGNARGTLAFSDSRGSVLGLSDAQGEPCLALALSPSGHADIELSKGKGSAYLGVDSSGLPNITLSDPQGFTMELGGAQTEVPAMGEMTQTSAASIVMFGNDQKRRVIWKAP